MPETADIDTSTPEGFSAGLEALGLRQRDRDGDLQPLRPARVALLLSAPESTVKNWLRGSRPVHPTAARMVDWMMEGYRPEGWHMTGDDFRAAREALELNEDQLGELLDVETDTILKWESDFHGPPGFVAEAMRWLLSGFRPSDFPTGAREEARP